jgi:hypothetical protein
MAPVILLAAGLLLTACATDTVTERTRLPFIDDKAPPSQVVPPATQEQPVQQNVPDTQPLEVPK